MTEKLAQAAQDARYLFQVYAQFSKPIPEAMLVKCCRDLVEGLEEYRAATGKNSEPVRHNLARETWDRELGMYITESERFSQ